MNKITPVDHENIKELADTDGLDSLVKLMEAKVEAIGNGILHENLKQNSFAQVGIELSKYQGAKELCNFVKRELKKYKKNSLQD